MINEALFILFALRAAKGPLTEAGFQARLGEETVEVPLSNFEFPFYSEYRVHFFYFFATSSTLLSQLLDSIPPLSHSVFMEPRIYGLSNE